MKNVKCDIIIPIYNAYECVKACVESVLKNTNFDKAHLILIDDKSPDERMVPLIEKYEKENSKKITVLKNDKNLGFVGTVNRGMKYSKNDVLLLNSDTEVSGGGWLDRIIKCAYSDKAIATVTPLSNNATLASVPEIFERNELPKGYDLEKMNEVVQKYSDREYPEIPTAHGFCMYIKRESLEKVGYFDEKNFGKGYGEENDFCFRCFEYGYRHVLCDDVYVLHKESQSFLDNKVDNGVALAKKHPELKNNLDGWCKMRDIKRIGKNIALGMGTEKKRENILILVHDFSNYKNNFGGTTIHILDLIRVLRKKYNFHVLAPEGGVYKVYSFFENIETVTAVVRKPFLIEPIGIYSNEYKRMIEEILDDYRISFVHIHHMIGHFFDIREVCRNKKIKYAVSLHDMYLKTPVVSLMDDRVKDEQKYPVKLNVWRGVCEKLMADAFEVIAPSEFTKREYNKVYKKQKIEVIPHGIKKIDKKIKRSLGEQKNIAFMGAIFPHKGSDILENLVGRIKSHDNIKIHLFGTTTARIDSGRVFINHGEYKREEISEKLRKNKIDLVCAFSLAPETFSYTTEEIIAAGVPILTFDIGAGAERIKENGLGWVLKYTDDVKKILKKIKEILEDEEGYQKVLKNIREYHVRSIDEMAAAYEKIYEKNVVAKKLNFNILQKKMLEADLVQDVILSEDSSKYRDDYFAMINSTKWRLISKIKVPKKVKKTIKKAMIWHK